MKGVGGTNWHLHNSHRAVDYHLGNIVNNIQINRYGARWAPEAVGGPLCKVHDFLTTLPYI